ncbi:MAG: ionic transporter y4hA, partial [Paludibacterium sp.]|nr:ionic transporter y4hA [Paludibacterium sp.]
MSARTHPLPLWTRLAPFAGWLLLAGQYAGLGRAWQGLLLAGLLVGVLAAVHHAEVVAHRVGEPFGTLVLAGAITAIEVALIVTLMFSGGSAASTLARDTLFATVMIILNGIVGLGLLLGGVLHREQDFQVKGASAALAVLAALVTLSLVLPNYTSTAAGPAYSPSQLAFAGTV